MKEYVSHALRTLHMSNRTELAIWLVRALGLLTFAAIATAQTAGTVTVVTTVTITSTAGTAPNNMNCNFTGNATTQQVTINCTGAGATLNSTLPLPLPAPGTVGNFGLSGNLITWAFVPASATPGIICPAGAVAGQTCWQVVANGTAKTGIF